MEFEQGKELRELSTFGIGGPARYFIIVHSIEEASSILRYAHVQSLPVLIIGKGSNSLFDDRGFDGLVILNKINFCTYLPDQVHVGSGFSFSHLGVQSARKGFSGLEFASGIPASVGGAIYMNAGASGGETATCLQSVTFITELGEVVEISKEELTFGYRTSSFQAMQGMIAAARFQLTPSEMARERQLQIIEYRTRTQPYGEMSCGCVFRNPPGFSAGALIDQAGLKGYAIGDAQISTVHANFIINRGKATSVDVLSLVTHIQERVREKTGIELEVEIRHISRLV